MLLKEFLVDEVNFLLENMRKESEEVIGKNNISINFIEERFVYMRYAGQGHEIKVPIDNVLFKIKDTSKIKETFEQEYKKLYTRILPNADIEILTWSLSLYIKNNIKNSNKKINDFFDVKSKKITNILNYENGKPSEIPIFERIELVPGNKINGQCIISEDQTTLIVSKDFSTKVLGNNFLQMDWIGDE